MASGPLGSPGMEVGSPTPKQHSHGGGGAQLRLLGGDKARKRLWANQLHHRPPSARLTGPGPPALRVVPGVAGLQDTGAHPGARFTPGRTSELGGPIRPLQPRAGANQFSQQQPCLVTGDTAAPLGKWPTRPILLPLSFSIAPQGPHEREAGARGVGAAGCSSPSTPTTCRDPPWAPGTATEAPTGPTAAAVGVGGGERRLCGTPPPPTHPKRGANPSRQRGGLGGRFPLRREQKGKMRLEWKADGGQRGGCETPCDVEGGAGGVALSCRGVGATGGRGGGRTSRCGG